MDFMNKSAKSFKTLIFKRRIVDGAVDIGKNSILIAKIWDLFSLFLSLSLSLKRKLQELLICKQEKKHIQD